MTTTRSTPANTFIPSYTIIDQPANRENDLGDALLASMHQCDSPLGGAFFSPSNIEEIQRNLRIIIRQKTGYLIDKQSVEHLAIVMRAMYAMHARHGGDVDVERRRLNAIVLSEVAPIVGSNISQYLGYLKDASEMAVPLERSKNLSIKGQNTFSLFRGL